MTEFSFPFHDEMLFGDEVIRTFSSEVDESELKWHQDNERRIIQIIEDGEGYVAIREYWEDNCSGYTQGALSDLCALWYPEFVEYHHAYMHRRDFCE